MFEATITINGDVDALVEVFKVDDTDFPRKRAVYSVEKQEKSLKIIVSAKDATAFRAVLNTITKILAVHEKAKRVVAEDG